MIIVKMILKIACLPFLLLLSLIKWFFVFVTAVSSVFFITFSVVVFITGVLSYGFGLESGSESFRIIVGGFIIFMLPVMAIWIITGISALQTILSEIIWS